MADKETSGFIPELEEIKEKPPSVPLMEILGAVANRPDLTEEQRRVLETLRPLIMDTAKKLAEPQPTLKPEQEEKESGFVIILDPVMDRIEETIPEPTPAPTENRNRTPDEVKIDEVRKKIGSSSAPISAESSAAEIVSPEKLEEEKRKWQKETKEFLVKSKIVEALNDLLNDQNLKQAQEKFHFDDSYAPYKFDIRQMVEEAGQIVQKHITASEIPKNCEAEFLLKLDPLTKLIDLPPTIKAKIDGAIKPFLNELSALTSKHPDNNGRTSEIFYPKNNEFFDDRNMLMTYEERTGERGGFGRVLKCLKPGLYSRNTDGTRDTMSFASTVTKG